MSEMYAAAACMKGVESVMANAPLAKIDDLTDSVQPRLTAVPEAETIIIEPFSPMTS